MSSPEARKEREKKPDSEVAANDNNIKGNYKSTRPPTIVGPATKILNIPPGGIILENTHRETAIVHEDRVIQGANFNAEQIEALLKNVSTYNEQTLWDLLNDNDLLPPRGKNLLPDFSDLTNFDNVKTTFTVACMILGVMTTSLSSANAEEKNKSVNSKQIEWALEALEKIDPINILLNEKKQREARKQGEQFSELEKSVLTWNIFHEARGEGEAGWEAVLLNNLYRMKSGKFASDAQGLAFQRFQFSYTRDILNGSNNQDKKEQVVFYTNIREMVDRFLSPESTLDNKIAAVKSSLFQKGYNMPENSLMYNTLEIMPLAPSFISELKLKAKYKNIRNPDLEKFNKLNLATKTRLLEASQKIMKGDLKFEIIGRHIFF